MKALFLALALSTVASAATWTEEHTDILNKRSLAFAKQLANSTTIVGRLGRADTRAAVVVSAEGHLICPVIKSIDGEPAPYILYHSDGTREELTTILEKEKSVFALLKTNDASPKLTPVPLAERIDDTVFVTGCAPIVTLNEKPHFQVCHLLYQPKEDSNTFALDLETVGLGDAIFNLDGKLVGLVSRVTSRGPQATLITSLVEKDTELSGVLPEIENSNSARLPAAPTLTKEEKQELEKSPLREARSKQVQSLFPSPLPCVLIFNVDQQLTHSVIGTVIDPNGLILTKASELGPKLSVRFAGKSHPAVLLSTDEASDLALVGIEATNMPVVRWQEITPAPGAPLFAPKLLDETTAQMVATKSALTGNYTGIQKAETHTIHQSSSVTSLGIVTEQLEDVLRVSALLPESSARKSGLTVGDLISKIDDQKITTRSALTDLLNSKSVGDTVQIEVSRGKDPQTYSLTLEAPEIMPPLTGVTASFIPMIPSVRRSPFPDCLAHAIPLNAWDCGSPLFDQDGKAIGLNIAAVSPGKTLALTPSEIRAALARLLANSRQF